MLCIAWVDQYNNMYRYAMWKDVNELVFFDIPLYAGQKIAKNFRFEIWNTASGSPVVQESDLQFFTSVLGGQDYRWAGDSSLVGNNGIVTDFDNINTPLPLPTADLSYNWQAASGLDVTGADINSWTDAVNGQVLLPTGVPQVIATDDIPVCVVVSSTATLSTTTASGPLDNIGYVAIAIYLPSLATSGSIYDNGNGIRVGFDGTNFTSFEDGVSTFAPEANHWYILILSPNSVATEIYDLQTSDFIELFNASTNIGANTTIVIGGATVILAEIAVYSNDIADEQYIVRYFTNKYFGSTFTLPLTFPTDSVPTTNTI